MKRNDLFILLAALVAGAALYLASGGLPAPANGANERAYLRVEMPDRAPALYPLDGERDIELEQADGRRNMVHLFTGGFVMAEASCKNHDCIEQGEVTLSNRNARALLDKVICLPNKVTLTLVAEGAEQAETLELEP